MAQIVPTMSTESVQDQQPSIAIQLAAMLFQRHTHADLLCKFRTPEELKEQVLKNPSEIIYKEADVIDLLHQLGYPTPDFESLRDAKFESISTPVANENGVRRFVFTPMERLKDFIEKDLIFHDSPETINASNEKQKEGMRHTCKQLLSALANVYLPMEAEYLKRNCTPKTE